jgi:cell wall-active antibiotic response 4TMS protein YvqF
MAERSYDSTPRDPMNDHRPRTRVTGRLLWGLIILGLGTAWTLDNLGLADSDAILRWWPMLLMAYGAAMITGWGARRVPFSGTLFMIAGAWLVLHELGYVATGLSGLWPLALILIGGRIVLRSARAPAARSDADAPIGGLDDRGRIRVDAGLATVERRIRSGVFSGGEVHAFMSGVVLDLRDATLADGKVTLEIHALMSGLELIVPRGWRVISEVSCVMGTVEDHTEHPADDQSPRATLILTGATIMASLEIKH